jgi:GxxExxY protein
MKLPQSHRDTEDIDLRTPQSHRDTEGSVTESPQSHKSTEESDINGLTQRVIGFAIEVHRVLGPGLLEVTYERAMCIEFDDAGVKYQHQVRVPACYKGRSLGEYHIDFIVEDLVVVEIKSVERMPAVFEAQVLTYLRVTKKHLGLLINFNSRLVKDGVTRLAL